MSLFTELPRRKILGNEVSGIKIPRKLKKHVGTKRGPGLLHPGPIVLVGLILWPGLELSP